VYCRVPGAIKIASASGISTHDNRLILDELPPNQPGVIEHTRGDDWPSDTLWRDCEAGADRFRDPASWTRKYMFCLYQHNADKDYLIKHPQSKFTLPFLPKTPDWIFSR
jgi:hypothetical protein